VFDFLPEFLRTPVSFVVVLGVLVFIHELGHYLAARFVGVHVETFSIGFGQALTKWRDRQGTEWRLAWLPLGGYVKLHGQERPEDVSPEARAAWLPGRTFHEKSVGARALVIIAGPAANFVLAIVLFTALYASVGRPLLTPQIGDVVAESAAARGGMMSGDRVLTIDGTAIVRFEDLQRIVSANAGHKLDIRVRRGDAELSLGVTPDSRESGGHSVGVLGVRGGAVEYTKLGAFAAISAGSAQTWDVTVQTLAGVWQMIAGGRGAEDLGGPLRIAQMSGQVAQLGFASLVSFVALLSVNLGLINLFPIPVLDGGHLVFYALEALRGRPLPPRAQDIGYRAGFALLASLFVFATWNDLGHVGLFRWVAGLIG
jgi:regulator of sigma E protease